MEQPVRATGQTESGPIATTGRSDCAHELKRIPTGFAAVVGYNDAMASAHVIISTRIRPVSMPVLHDGSRPRNRLIVRQAGTAPILAVPPPSDVPPQTSTN